MLVLPFIVILYCVAFATGFQLILFRSCATSTAVSVGLLKVVQVGIVGGAIFVIVKLSLLHGPTASPNILVGVIVTVTKSPG